jgi:signal transduction histidine kinase
MQEPGQSAEVGVGWIGAPETTDRRALEEALADYRTAIRDSTRLNRLFAILSDRAPLDVVVDHALMALSELFAADIVVLLRLNEAATLVPFGSIGLPEDIAALPFSGTEDGYSKTVIASHRPVLVESCLDDRRMEAQLRNLDVRTAVWLPVLGSQEVVGVLALCRCLCVPFSRSDTDLLMAMAHRIGQVLDRAQADENRLLLEATMRQAEKSESLGRMAAAIAHHFNNKLTAVMGSLEMAALDLDAGHDAREDIDEARKAARDAAAVSKMMLAYLGHTGFVRETQDLGALCRTLLPGLVRRLPGNVQLDLDIPDRPEMVSTDASDIQQLLINLVDNAAEAMAGREGQILLSLRETPAPAVGAATQPPGWTAEATAYACLKISDNGSGMDPAVLRNAFDPFYSTKFTGRGLGLAVVLGIVRAYGGMIRAESKPGRGSTFRVFLPLAEAPPTG